MRAQGAQAAHHGLQCLQLQARAMQSTTLIEGRRVRSSPNLTLRYADALGSIQKPRSKPLHLPLKTWQYCKHCVRFPKESRNHIAKRGRDQG